LVNQTEMKIKTKSFPEQPVRQVVLTLIFVSLVNIFIYGQPNVVIILADDNWNILPKRDYKGLYVSFIIVYTKGLL